MKGVIAKGIEQSEFSHGADAGLVIRMLKRTLFFILNMHTVFNPEEIEIASRKEGVNQFFTDVLKRYLIV